MPENQDIINRYLRDGKLYTLPSKRNKRLVVLEYILSKFEPDKSYKETEVNRIIANLFSDFCRVRREFIDENMMIRKDGIYRRM